VIKRIFIAGIAVALLAATPTPAPPPVPQLPNKPLHAKFTVEVNRKGQVVRVDHGTLSGDRAIDTMLLGNAMQMWIRHPDGTAVPGLYTVSYDYDPRTKDLRRVPVLLSAGGAWANKQGAATLIVAEMKREAEAAYARIKAEQQKKQAESAKNLPDINAAVRRAMHSPSPSPKP